MKTNNLLKRLTVSVAVMAGFTLATLPMHAWAADPGISDKEIVLGAIAPFTGPAGPLGYAAVLGLQIGVEEVNAAGGVNGRKIKFVAEDDAYIPSRTVQAFNKLMDVDHIFALTAGSGSSHWLAILPQLESEGIPSINPLMASLAPFEAAPKTHFGVGISYREAAYNMMKVLSTRHPGLKWASMVQDDESGIDREVGFEQAAKELKLDVAMKARYKRGQTDFSADVLRLKQAGVTGLFLGGLPTDDAAIVKDLKRLDVPAKVGTLWLSHSQSILDLMGDAGQGVYLYDFVPSMDDPSLAPFRELAKKYLKPADEAKINRYTVTGYVTMRFFIEAMKQCGKDLTRACTIQKMDGLKNFNTGIMSPITFSPGKHLAVVQGQPLMMDVANKRFVPLK
jgi:branched-chain amino acid transport system substrate-binding protein